MNRACNLISAITVVVAVNLNARDAHISVRANDVLHTRPISLIGGNTEDLNYQLYGGLYSQLIYGEAFEEEIGVDFIGLTDRQKLNLWVYRDGNDQPFLYYFSGRDIPRIDEDTGNFTAIKFGKALTIGPLTFEKSCLAPDELPGELGKKLLERFTGPEQVSRHWKKLQSNSAQGSFTLVRKGQLTGKQAQQITFSKGTGEWGIENAGPHGWGIKFEKGKPYEGILRVKSDTKQDLHLSLRDSSGNILARKQVKLAAKPGVYQRVEFSLSPKAETASGRFALALGKPGTVTVDYVFLQPGPWGRYHDLPVRLDFAKALESMTMAAIRYNGSMVNRSPNGHLYKWKEMIGPRDERTPYHGWFNPYASHGFTFFEFMDLCEIMDIDCMFGIRIDETAQDVEDLVEYCLGGKDTEWGRKRIELGHPRPYRLQIIQIGNEEIANAHYAERVKALAGAAWNRDPNVEIALSINSGRPRQDVEKYKSIFLDIARFVNDRGQNGKLVLDSHYWGEVGHADTDLKKFVGMPITDYLAEAIPGFRLRLWPMEENGTRCDWNRGLAHAHNLNTLSRMPLILERSGTANIFQAWDKQLIWDQGRIHFTPEKIFYQPSYYVDRMIGVEWLPVVLNASSSDPELDVTAKASEKGDILNLYIANVGDEASHVTFKIEGFEAKAVSVTRIGSDDWTAHNTPENPEAIVPVKIDWNVLARDMTIPGRSFTSIRFSRSLK